MREKRFRWCDSHVPSGITPACAGKTTSFFLKFAGFWDHPRVCGKNKPTKFTEPQAAGSPPRVREKPLCLIVESVVTGITPACAGKTKLAQVLGTSTEDHPRVCGKNMVLPQNHSVYLGSPPRVREKLVSYKPSRDEFQDHPRVCGKNALTPSALANTLGSPPRVREKH